MDILYPLCNKSQWDNNEIRYSLRSVEKHLKGYDRVFIIGDKPDWLTNVIHIPMQDKSGCRQMNIMEKVRRGCMAGISDEFVFFNDDHYLLCDTIASQIPYFKSGTLADKGNTPVTANYARAIANTIRELSARGYNTAHFDVHTPIIYDRNKFLDVMMMYAWKPPTYLIKSLYCNSVALRGVEIKDNKHDGGYIDDSTMFISSGDAVTGDMAKFLATKFPEKSSYEAMC